MSAPSKLCIADQDHLLKLMLDGISERRSKRELITIANEFLESIGTPMSLSTVYSYINEAKDEFNLASKKDRQRVKTNAIVRLNALYKRCIAQGDNSTALKIEKELTLLRGVYKDLETQDQEQTINIVFRDATKEDVDE